MKNEGGPAFPVAAYTLDTSGKPMLMVKDGMPLRDYFIAHAPAQEIANLVPISLKDCAAYLGIDAADYRRLYERRSHYLLVLAKARGEWADAMIEAGKKP